MPFKSQVFLENARPSLSSAPRAELEQACRQYASLTTPKQKAKSIQRMMEVLDRDLDLPRRKTIMEACGRRCIGASTLAKARQLQRGAQDLDDLLVLLNQAHIGGGHLRREEHVIHAAYDRCYCGSVNQANAPFSSTYCQCSCGWFRQLFETLLGKPVEVELLDSILQGAERCRFTIHLEGA
jgi:predicted hydrocarbon binding protein